MFESLPTACKAKALTEEHRALRHHEYVARYHHAIEEAITETMNEGHTSTYVTAYEPCDPDGKGNVWILGIDEVKSAAAGLRELGYNVETVPSDNLMLHITWE